MGRQVTTATTAGENLADLGFWESHSTQSPVNNAAYLALRRGYLSRGWDDGQENKSTVGGKLKYSVGNPPTSRPTILPRRQRWWLAGTINRCEWMPVLTSDGSEVEFS
ncbi:hypothetical protein EMPG_13482 [Blastomyces silverae]|uniref:Uncharacterized protein n=1 Tax=Blastomyces silverae TaxID=2060906 RepID=A0A0H1BPX0_9EURO|nr:hypothetical protein EMPG_13482 [Blastomyces silverae]